MKEGLEFRLHEDPAYGKKVWVNPERIDMIAERPADDGGCYIICSGDHCRVKDSYASVVNKVSESLELARMRRELAYTIKDLERLQTLRAASK